jgi:hypothetical protein
MYTADLPTSPTTTIATFADDTAVLATVSDPAVASQKFKTHLLAINIWLKGIKKKVVLPSNENHIGIAWTNEGRELIVIVSSPYREATCDTVT